MDSKTYSPICFAACLVVGKFVAQVLSSDNSSPVLSNSGTAYKEEAESKNGDA